MINEKIKRILSNRGLNFKQVGEKLGMTKQGVSWILNNRKDENWTEKERMIWCSKMAYLERAFRDE